MAISLKILQAGNPGEVEKQAIEHASATTGVTALQFDRSLPTGTVGLTSTAQLYELLSKLLSPLKSSPLRILFKSHFLLIP